MKHKPGDIWFENGIGYTLTDDGCVIAVKTENGVCHVGIVELGPDGKPQGACFEGSPLAALGWLFKQEENKP